jgi:preprotein translocase subunit SecB
MADPQQGGDGAQSAAFTIDKIYLKDLSLENPGSPQTFLVQEQPQVEVGLRTRGEQVQPDVYESVLTVTLTAKVGDKTLFLVEASQAGLFTIRGVPPEHLQQVIAINCPTVLFPVHSRNARGRRVARRLSADPSRPDQLRDAVPAAARGAGAAGLSDAGGRQLSEAVRGSDRRRPPDDAN